jgi:hypothetical protein
MSSAAIVAPRKLHIGGFTQSLRAVVAIIKAAKIAGE